MCCAHLGVDSERSHEGKEKNESPSHDSIHNLIRLENGFCDTFLPKWMLLQKKSLKKMSVFFFCGTNIKLWWFNNQCTFNRNILTWHNPTYTYCENWYMWEGADNHTLRLYLCQLLRCPALYSRLFRSTFHTAGVPNQIPTHTNKTQGRGHLRERKGYKKQNWYECKVKGTCQSVRSQMCSLLSFCFKKIKQQQLVFQK